MDCAAAITEKAARDFYDHLLATHAADGCTVEEVETDKTRMTVLWKAHGRPMPVAEVVRKECAPADAVSGPSFAIRVPEPLRDACPSTVEAAVAIVRSEPFDVTVAAGRPPSTIAMGLVGATALAVLVFNVSMILRHRR